MKARPLLLIPILAACACTTERAGRLQSALEARIGDSGAEIVGVYFYDLDTGDSLALNADVRLHAASTMKSIPIRNTFRSIADQSPYQLSLTDDSDSTPYARIGQRASVRELTELMITVSSNLAANVLIELVGAERVQHSMRELGADSIAVLRGVEDIEAYEAGLNNTTTARDLGIILTAIAEARAADEASCREMLDILARQMFNDGIPAGLPDGTRVAHKTGLITRINHDTAVVELPSGRRYVLVVLVRGIEDPSESDILVADISRIVYERVLIAE
jgi:beta-lactamase class A